MNEFNPKKFAKKFTLSDEILQLLYSYYISAHTIQTLQGISSEHILLSYTNEVRELKINEIKSLFDELDNILVDLFILTWCIPSNIYLSSDNYYNEYKKNIMIYNKKLFNNKHIDKFNKDILGKLCYVPIHCLQFLHKTHEEYITINDYQLQHFVQIYFEIDNKNVSFDMLYRKEQKLILKYNIKYYNNLINEFEQTRE